MEITVRIGDLLRETAELGVLVSAEDTSLPTDVAGLLEPADFRGRAKQTLLLYPRGAGAPRRLLLVGLGKREAVSADSLRQAAAIAVQQARALQVTAFTLGVNGELPLAPERMAQALAEGLELGAYRY
ncbi:MAG: leucyl aminopeptidase, partial [Chloroflexales bacterium]|nr:leucyl aminopeptidase [Chloroflexales bacterium]